jgi:hypothetical protein
VAEKSTGSPDGLVVIRKVLATADPRPLPDDPQPEKNAYAIRFADEMADQFAEGLAPLMAGITASSKRTASSVQKKKQLDVNFSTPAQGLALGISLKSVHIREAKGAKRYTHNLKRNEEELRIEASGYHKRQPYAVMIGVLFLPYDSCDDGKRDNPSSFGSWVRHLRPYSGRSGPKDDEDRFEKIYVGLYEPDGSAFHLFDINLDPPKNGRPQRGLSTYGEFLQAVYHLYLRHNSADFHWDDGTEEPLDPETDEE